MNWDQNILAALNLASPAFQTASETPLVIEPNSHLIRKWLRRTYHALSASLPEKSVMDILSVFGLSEAPEPELLNSPKEKLGLSIEVPSHPLTLSLVFADDARNPELFNSKSFVDPTNSSKDANQITLDQSTGSTANPAMEAILAGAEADSVSSALRLYLTDLYATYLCGTSSLSAQSTDEMLLSIYRCFPALGVYQSPMLPQPSPCSSSSIEFGLLAKLSLLSEILARHGRQTELVAMIETLLLFGPQTLREKYLRLLENDGSGKETQAGANGNLENRSDVPSSSLDVPNVINPFEPSGPTNVGKLTEYRIQTLLHFFVWRFTSSFPLLMPQNVLERGSGDEASDLGKMRGTRKLEMDQTNRKTILALLENIGFLLSSLSDSDTFKEYVNDLIRMVMYDTPNMALWIKNKLGLNESYQTPSHLVLDLSLAPQPHSSRPSYHPISKPLQPSRAEGTTNASVHSANHGFLPSQFLVNLIDSTSGMILDPRNTANKPKRERMTTSDAFSLLTQRGASTDSLPSLNDLFASELIETDVICPRKQNSKRIFEENSETSLDASGEEAPPSSKRLAL
jgi:hypothetical protein